MKKIVYRLLILTQILFLSQGLFSHTFAYQSTIDATIASSILEARKNTNYGRFSLQQTNGNISTVWMVPHEIEQAERQFTIAIQNLTRENTSLQSFLQAGDSLRNSRNSALTNMQLANNERTKNGIRVTLYDVFRIQLTNPNEAPFNPPVTTPTPPPQVPITDPIPLPPISQTQPTPQRTFIQIENYTTLNGKLYTLRRDNEGFFRYRQNDGAKFRNILELKDYIEYHNRIIHIAPNQRKYGIYKLGTMIVFSRDDGRTTSSLSWNTVEDAIAYINQHNQPVPGCQIVEYRVCR